MAAPVASAAYDDGSSTESEYYFDPTEDAEEAATFAWAHGHDAPTTVKQEEVPVQIKQEECNTNTYTIYSSAVEENAEEIALPQGSEWSHGATSSVCDNDDAVERALAMARELGRKLQREEEMTADTLNSNASPVEKEEEKEKTVVVTNQKKKIKQKLVLLKTVKATTPPASVAVKSVAVGLRRSPEVVGTLAEVDKELSVARPQWKPTESQSTSPSHSKTKEGTEEKKTRRTERGKSSSVRRTEHSNVKNSTTEQSKAAGSSRGKDRRRSRCPSIRRVEYDNRSKPAARSYSRRSRSKSPPNRRSDDKRRRSRSRSRSPYRSTSTASPRSRSYRDTERSSPRYSDRRSSQSYERSRSPSRLFRPRQSTHIRFRSRSRSSSRSRSRSPNSSRSRPYDRYDHRSESRHDRSDRSGRSTAQQISDKKNLDRRPDYRELRNTSSGTQQYHQDTAQHRNYDHHHTDGTRLHEKKNQAASQKVEHNNASRSGQNNSRTTTRVDASSVVKQRFQGSEPSQPRRPAYDKEVLLAAIPNVGTTVRRSPKGPRAKPREGGPSPHDNGKTITNHYFDPFQRRVFKLKLQEADAAEKEAEYLSEAERKLYIRRRHNCEVERARLEAENLERFERFYASTVVSSTELKKYQHNRDFAWRVICFKQRQASLQQQNDLFVSAEAKADSWRQLDEDREKLIAENEFMFHKVMMEQGREFLHRETSGVRTPRYSGKRVLGPEVNHGQPNAKRRQPRTTPLHLQSGSSASSARSRVVVGAALQGDGGRTSTPWFLKG